MNDSINRYYGITTIRISDCNRDDLVESVTDKYEIYYIMAGECTLTVEGTDYPMRAGSIATVAPNAYRMLDCVTDAPFDCLLIRFGGECLLGDVTPMLDKIAPECSALLFTADTALACVEDIPSRLNTSRRLPEQEGEMYVRMVISELVLMLSVSVGEHRLSAEDDLIANVMRYLNNNVTSDISLEGLSRRFFVSKYYLCRAFKKRSGISIHGYITAKRIAYARQLIAEGETASSVAYKVGYGDYSAFYRAYLKQTGTSPGEAKKG